MDKTKKLTPNGVKVAIVKAIKAQYGVGVSEFSRSEVAKKANLNEKNLSSLLSPNGAVSFPVMKELCIILKLGNLEKKVRIIRTVDYYL